MELFATAVASNSLLAFCLCNLIIIILFLSGPKPSSPGTQESLVRTHEVLVEIEKEEKTGDEGFISEDIEASSSANVVQLSNVINSPSDELDSNDCTEESDNEDLCTEDDDELRRRVEEFIEKVNRGWKAEKLMSLDLYRSTHMVI